MIDVLKDFAYDTEWDGQYMFCWIKPQFIIDCRLENTTHIKVHIDSPTDRYLSIQHENENDVKIIKITRSWREYYIEHKKNTLHFSIKPVDAAGDNRNLGLKISKIEFININYKNILLVGSAWYVKDWWEENRSNIKKYNHVCSINNAFLITQEMTDEWYMANDFIYSNGFDMRKFYSDSMKDVAKKVGITSWFLSTPHWYAPHPRENGTMLLNSIYDILNKSVLHKNFCKLDIIGCDLNYSNNKPHFYGVGTSDPLRLGEDYLKQELAVVKGLFDIYNYKITNLSKHDGLLPFDRE